MHKYTDLQKKFLEKNIKGVKVPELTKIFNACFGLSLKDSQIQAYKKNHCLKSGLITTFQKGQEPPNKGKKGVGGWEPTQFKKGHKPHNRMDIGSERINGEGYIEIKTSDPNNWAFKHILIWEKHNGLIPKGHVIIFGDSDKQNTNIENLILVSRRQLLALNRNNLMQKDAELTKTAIVITDLLSKIAQKKKL